MFHVNPLSFFRSAIPRGTSVAEIEELKKDFSYSNRGRTWLILFAALLTGAFFLILRLTAFETIITDLANRVYIIINTVLILITLIFIALFSKIRVSSPSDINNYHTYINHCAVFSILIVFFISAGVELSIHGTFSKGVAAFFALSILVTVNWVTILGYFIAGIIAAVTTVYCLSDKTFDSIYGQVHIIIVIFIALFISRTLYIGAIKNFFVRKELETTNTRLKSEISNRLHTLEELKVSNNTLENRVTERTENLQKANELLKQEVSGHQRTEKMLRQTEAQSRTLIEKMNDGFVVFNENRLITYANDKLCEMLGLEPDKVLNHNILDFIPAECPLPDGCFSIELSHDQESYEVIFKKCDGSLVNTIVSPQPLYSDENITGSFSVVTDITKIKKMENALRGSEEMSRALLNASSDAVMMLKSDGSILAANEMTARILSVNRTMLTGKNIFDFFINDTSNGFKQTLSQTAVSKTPEVLQESYNNNFYAIHIYPINDGRECVERIAVFARDITKLKNAEKHIHSLSQELIKVQENERQKISRDLHDNVAQDLATLKIGCDTLFDDDPGQPRELIRKVEGFSRILHQSIMSIRNMAYDLRPPGLDQLGIVTTISRLCEDFSDRHLLRIDFYSAGISELTLNPDTEINLYRLVQEALNNITKHAEATLVTIRLLSSFPTIMLKIEDDGKGFDVQKRREEVIAEKRMGIQSMEERAALLHGTIKINSKPLRGTRIVIEIPFIKNADQAETTTPLAGQ